MRTRPAASENGGARAQEPDDPQRVEMAGAGCRHGSQISVPASGARGEAIFVLSSPIAGLRSRSASAPLLLPMAIYARVATAVIGREPVR
jgi:hypothetical protein